MQKTTSDKPRDIQQSFFFQLECLDFADDLAALSSNYAHLQEGLGQDNPALWAKQDYAAPYFQIFKRKYATLSHINSFV